MIIIRFRGETVPREYLPFFNVNEEGIRVMECALHHIQEIEPWLRGRHLEYPVPQNLCAKYYTFGAASMMEGLEHPKTDYCDYVLELKLYLTAEKLNEIWVSQCVGGAIRKKKIEECSVTELLVAVNHKLKEEQTQSADG